MNGGGCESDILQRPEKCQFYPLGAPTRRNHFESNQTVSLTSFSPFQMSSSRAKLLLIKIKWMVLIESALHVAKNSHSFVSS